MWKKESWVGGWKQETAEKISPQVFNPEMLFYIFFVKIKLNDYYALKQCLWSFRSKNWKEQLVMIFRNLQFRISILSKD